MYYLLVFLHVFAALVWLGGMFFLGLVGAPVLRSVEPAEVRQQLFRKLGMRFRTLGWVAITALVLTGFGILEVRGILRSGALAEVAFWQTTFGMHLAVKLVLVVAMIGMSAYHDFLLGPAAGRAISGSPEAITLRRKSAMNARINAILGLVLLYVATRLARG